MKKVIIFDERVFGHKLVMYRIKRANGESWYSVVSGIQPLCNGLVVSTQDRNKADDALKKAAQDIVSYEIARFNKLHGIV
jgi:hypothetical protein